jgi:ribosomal protein L7/L12
LQIVAAVFVVTTKHFLLMRFFSFSETSGIQRLRTEIGFSVQLINIGSNKAKVIFGVRDVAELSISEAKFLVEKAPCEIVEGVGKWKAFEIAKKLKSLGADVKIINKLDNDASSVNEPAPDKFTD